MRPTEVLDAQADLLTRSRDRRFRLVLAAWGEAEVGRHADLNDAERKAQGQEVVDTITEHVRLSYAYRVTHDMSLMVEWAASQLDDTDAFLPDLAPTPWGFVTFDRPLPLHDVRGQTMLIHYLVWGPASAVTLDQNRIAGVAFSTFNDTWRQPDEVALRLRESLSEPKYQMMLDAMGRWGAVGLQLAFPGQRLGPTVLDVPPEQAAEILAEGDVPTPGTNALRYLHALWLLLGQTVTATVVDTPDRAGRRRAGRAGIPAQVTVIRLRREEYPTERPEGESQVEWQHRWIVRAHWRWQRYGPVAGVDHEHEWGPIEVVNGGLNRHCVVEGCENYVARIIIPWTVKGPADAPFKQSEKVYSLDR